MPRFSAAHSVRAIGPTTRSFGANRSLSQPHTDEDEGLLNEATAAPDVLVKVMTFPEVRPKYFTFGWSRNGVTVSVLLVYAFHADVM